MTGEFLGGLYSYIWLLHYFQISTPFAYSLLYPYVLTCTSREHSMSARVQKCTIATLVTATACDSRYSVPKIVKESEW